MDSAKQSAESTTNMINHVPIASVRALSLLIEQRPPPKAYWFGAAVFALVKVIKCHKHKFKPFFLHLNDEVWYQIANDMQRLGYEYTGQQCRQKFRTFKNRHIRTITKLKMKSEQSTIHPAMLSNSVDLRLLGDQSHGPISHPPAVLVSPISTTASRSILLNSIEQVPQLMPITNLVVSDVERASSSLPSITNFDLIQRYDPARRPNAVITTANTRISNTNCLNLKRKTSDNDLSDVVSELKRQRFDAENSPPIKNEMAPYY